jgi:acetyltransferase
MSVLHLDALLHARGVLLLGAPSSAPARQFADNILRTLPASRRWIAGVDQRGFRRVSRDAVPETDLALAFDPAEATSGMIGRLGEAGVRALIWAADSPVPQGVLAAAQPWRIRVLGSRSAGVIHPRKALNISGFSQPVSAGRLAMITQSKTVAAAALDWAAGRGIGFSWVAVTGTEADVDVADLLDFAALDPHTHAVVLQMSRLRNARKFMSAARACARGKPVTVLQSAPGIHGASADPMRSSAFRRAGFVECDSLGGLFGAIAALDRLPDVARQRVLVVANGAGVCALGLAACQREGITNAQLGEQSRLALLTLQPAVRFMPGAVDLSAAEPALAVDCLRQILDDGDVDAVIYLHAPMPGALPIEYARALAASGLGPRLTTVWLGLASVIEARALSAEGGMPTFPSAGDAAYALAVRQEYRRTQELLMQTPPPVALQLSSRAGAAQLLASAAISGETVLDEADAAGLVRDYGIVMRGRPRSRHRLLRIGLRRHSELGVMVAVEDQACIDRGIRSALPPLDGLLAARLMEDAGMAPTDGLVRSLVRLAQLAVDQPHIDEMDLEVALDPQGRPRLASGPRLTLLADPPDARQRLALAPYPQQLEGRFRDRQRHWQAVRAVRPEDEPAVLGLLQRTEPDAIRLRFFRYIKHFSHAMAVRLTQLDYDRETALVVIPERSPERIIALGHLFADPDGLEAEFAILVHQDFAGRGIGREVMERLLAHARDKGIQSVYGEVLSENRGMLALAAGLGFEQTHTADVGVLRVRISTAGTAKERLA